QAHQRSLVVRSLAAPILEVAKEVVNAAIGTKIITTACGMWKRNALARSNRQTIPGATSLSSRAVPGWAGQRPCRGTGTRTYRRARIEHALLIVPVLRQQGDCVRDNRCRGMRTAESSSVVRVIVADNIGRLFAGHRKASSPSGEIDWQ